MLQTIDVGQRSLASYRGVVPNETLDELVSHAGALQGARVLHLNATPYGGGVSEMLRSLVPILNDLGLIADWQVISGDSAFFEVTKTIHNGLQGAPGSLSDEQRATYMANAERNAARMQEEYDFIFVHDPQPAAILSFHGKGDAHWLWRCHIDTSEPNHEVWEFLRGFLGTYDAAIFTMPQFLPPDLPTPRVEIIPPAIDPLSPKNFSLPDETSRRVLDWIGIELDRPLITQISRFDPWKDPLGVIAAFRLVREQVPHLQLALVGSMALDDPEGWDVYTQIAAESASDPAVHLFTNLTGAGNIEVNAFQRSSDVVVQKSVREGFGLVVSEALWKGTPVVAGRAGGIPLQMADGVGGLLTDTVEQCAAAITELLTDHERARELAERGQERVRENFLLPRLVLNELTLMLDLARERPIKYGQVGGGARRDPVCGMAIRKRSTALEATFEGAKYAFCSEACRLRFLDRPEHYVRHPSPGRLR